MRFESYPSLERHVGHLLTLAFLYGVRDTPAFRKSDRVLDIGCGVGTLLIAFAIQYPEVEFVGIDTDEKALEEAESRKASLELKNLRFENCSFEQRAGVEKYDVVLAHGLYSWIHTPLRSVLLDSARTCLKPEGVLYISINSAPGWNLRGRIAHDLRSALARRKYKDEENVVTTAREELMRRHEVLQVLIDMTSIVEREEIEQLLQQTDEFLFHEILNPQSDAIDLRQFRKVLRGHDLTLVCDAKLSRMRSLDQFGQHAQQTHNERLAAEEESREAQQYAFRGMLVCAVDRSITDSFSPGKAELLFVSSSLVPHEDTPDIFSDALEVFVAPNGERISWSDPMTKAALLVLRKYWPEPISFVDLCETASQLLGHQERLEMPGRGALAEVLFKLFFDGFVDLFGSNLLLSSQTNGKLKIFPLARLQSQEQNWVTTLRGECAEISAIERYLFRLLDGTEDHRSLRENLLASVQKGELQPRSADGQVLAEQEVIEYLDEEVRQLIADIREKALLMKID
jgi:SAM-dependent methyltransferase/methyltransferase-like protein